VPVTAAECAATPGTATATAEVTATAETSAATMLRGYGRNR